MCQRVANSNLHRGHTTILGVSHLLPQVCEELAQIAAPLYRLSEKKKAWIWNEECEVAFDTLKKKLTSAPILAFPDFTEAFSRYCATRHECSLWCGQYVTSVHIYMVNL